MKMLIILRGGTPTLKTALLQVTVLALYLLCCTTTAASAAQSPPQQQQSLPDITSNSQQQRSDKFSTDQATLPIPLQPLPYFKRFERVLRRYVILEGETDDRKDSASEAELLAFTRNYVDLSPTVVRDAVLGFSSGLESGAESYNVSEVCIQHLAATVNGWMNRTSWAIQMLDAMGKPQPGVSEGATRWIGAYNLCRKVRATVNVTKQPQFSGQYCTAYVLPDSTKTSQHIDIGVCLPDSCSAMDMNYILGEIMIREKMKQAVYFSCVSDVGDLDTRAIVAIVILSVLLFCMIVGTALDVAYRQVVNQEKKEAERYNSFRITNNSVSEEIRETAPLLDRKAAIDVEMGICSKIFMTFSVYTNGSKLLSTNQPPGSLTSVHGIRFLSMTWVVLGHSFMMPEYFANNVLQYTTEAGARWTFQAISNATFSVDTFFVLSGLLVSCLSLKEMKKKSGRLNWFLFYFHRFWRLTPAYMLVIMVVTCLSPYWSSGPNTPNKDDFPEVKNCKANWGYNLLYVNNFVNADDLCVGQTWYLANDMQFYILSPLIFVPYYFGALWGTLSSGVFLLATAIVPGVLESQQYFSPGSFAQVEGNHQPTESYMTYFYIKPWNRMGPYVIGLMAGYLLYRTDCKLVINKFLNLLLWAVATAAALAVLYGLYDASNGHPMSIGLASFYAAVSRQVWGACIAWVVIACCTGNGGFVNTILSWPGLIPLSRLTYCIYLLHLMILDLYYTNQNSAFYMSDVNAVMFFLSALMVSYMASFVASLAFEAPMMGLEKLLFRRDSSHDNHSKK